MRIFSKVLLTIAGLIFFGVVLLLLVMAGGNESVILIGGWGLIFLGVPLIGIFLICLFFGIALRLLSKKSESAPQAADAPKDGSSGFFRKAMGWVAMAAGAVMVVFLVGTILSWMPQ